MSFQPAHRPVRRNYHPSEKFQVITNTFRVEPPRARFDHYDVVIVPPTKDGDKPKLPSRTHSVEVMNFLQTRKDPASFSPHRGAFDGRRGIYIQNSKIAEGRTWTFEMPPGSGRTYTVKLSRVNTIHPGALDAVVRGKSGSLNSEFSTAVMALNVIARAAPLETAKVFNSRAFYSVEANDVQPLGKGLMMARGFYQSIRPATNMMIANIDMVHIIMYKHGNLVDVVLDFFGRRNLSDLIGQNIPSNELRRLARFLKGRFVVFNEHNPARGLNRAGRPKGGKIEDVEIRGADRYQFIRDGTSITVADYYTIRTNRRLRCPSIICVKMEGGEPATIIPLELLDVPVGEVFRKDPPPEVTAQMIKLTQSRPANRFRDIELAYRAMNYNTSDYVAASGMQVDSTLIRAPARRLLPPQVMYGSNQVDPWANREKQGFWDVRNQILFRPAQNLSAWIVVVFDRKYGSKGASYIEKELVYPLVNCLRGRGLLLPRQPPQIYCNVNPQGDIGKLLDECVQRAMPSFGLDATKPVHWSNTLVITVLSPSSPHVRDQVKRWGDMTRGIPTQIVVGDTIFRPRGKDQYCNNLTLKINAKLGGVNAEIQNEWFQREPTMIIGLDISHAGPGSKLPSVSAMVSTVSEHQISSYVASSRPQEARLETITALPIMFDKAIYRWNAAHQTDKTQGQVFVPKRIVVFRDGVSEGEYERIAKEELTIMHNYYKNKKLGDIKITFIIVGKRHHIRMMPVPGGQTDSTGNCQSGTIIDDLIVHPIYFDWYLQSHKGLIGTSRPAHFTVLYDANNMTADELQKLSFDLCHVYARSTSAVSIPAPVYYADIVCSRLKYHLDPKIYDLEGSQSSEAGLEEKPLEVWQKFYSDISPGLKNRMYWM